MTYRNRKKGFGAGPDFQLKNLVNNSRFYILITSFFLSIGLFCYLRIVIPDDRLWIIRSEQTFGFMSIVYWYIALSISPLTKVIGQKSWTPYLIFGRRAVGVSAAYYAILHFAIAFWPQLGGLASLGLFPRQFLLSLALGFISLLILCAMAATSFDRVIKIMTFRCWKWLHRLTYLAGVAVIVHVWMIGTHTANSILTYTIFQLLVVLFGLEAIRISRQLSSNGFKLWLARLTGLVIWIGLAAGLLLLRANVTSQSLEHKGNAGQPGAVDSHDHP